MAAEPACPDCDTPLQRGVVPDFSHGAVLQLMWIAGTPQAARIFGLKTGSMSAKTSEALAVDSYRCPDCGLLREYATRPFDQWYSEETG